VTRLTFSTIGGIDAADLVMPEHVGWTSADGFETRGLLFTPKKVVPGQHGCLVEIHGGPMNQSRSVWNGLLQYFVQRGWAVVQPNYRGTLGYGRAYREALFGAWGKGDLLDYLGGVDLCAERGLIRNDRVVAWGGSAGGYSTVLCLTGAPERFAAGVALFGLYDLYSFGLETHRYERYYVETILGSSAENYPLWYERSPLNFLDRVQAPILFLQGGKDPAVEAAQSETVIRELERLRIDHEYVFYPEEGHGFRKVVNNIDYFTRMERFLSQKVLRAPLPGPLGTLPYPPMPLNNQVF
jgi:dipeptidyl aminopeptidase/acylaminoacyl peptidase